MTTERFFEVILATLKKEYGEEFESLSQEEKINLIMIFANQVTKNDKEIMTALAAAVYSELNI